MIAEHQQERFIADPLFGTIDRMTEAILGVLNDKRNSVYSRAAALERKIEIQSVNLKSKTDSLPHISFDKEILNLGKRKKGKPIEVEFEIENTGNAPLEVYNVEGSCSCTVIEQGEFSILQGEKRRIKAEINTEELFGELTKKITVFSNSEPKEKTFVVIFEIIENN